MGEKRLLTVKETAEYLGLATQTIYNQMHKGTFPVKPKRPTGEGGKPLFDKRDLDAWIDLL